MSVLTALGVDHHVAGDNAGSPGATSARQRPDGLLSFRNVLMFKVCLRYCHSMLSCCLIGMSVGYRDMVAHQIAVYMIVLYCRLS